MFVEVATDNFAKYQQLFSIFEYTIAVDAILKGYSAGRLFLANDRNPEFGILWDGKDGLYISAKTFSDQVVAGIHEIFSRILLPHVEQDGNNYVYVAYCNQKQVFSEIARWLSTNWEVEKQEASFFAFGSKISSFLENQANIKIKQDLSIISLDQATFNSSIHNITLIQEEVEQDWRHLGDFLRSGIGFAILNQTTNSIISWCVATNICDNKVELGIETLKDFQHQGLGNNLANYTIQECFNWDLLPHWYCFSSNIGSMKLAKKLGFSLVKTDQLCVMEFKSADTTN